MSLPISIPMQSALNNEVKTPQLILEIDGIGSFSSVTVKKYPLYGDDIYYGDDGLYYGGLIDDGSILPWIDLSKSSNSINQQLNPDKGGFSSVTNFDVAVIDKDGRVSEMILAGNLVNDILSCKARLYLSLEGAGHPHDSILFFAGIITGAPAGAGYIKFNVSSPEKLKNLEIFPKVSTILVGALGSGDTTINVESTTDFMVQADAGTLTTYIVINDEIIKYTGKTTTTFTGCTRGQFGTIAVAASDGDNVESAYRIIGNLRDLALKIMLSGLNTAYYSDGEILGFNSYGIYSVSNAIFVDDLNFKYKIGAVVGDTITISDSINAGNNGAAIITAIEQTDINTYIVLNKTLVTEGPSATFTLTSQYAVLPKFAGLEMTPDQVDAQEFIDKYNQFSASFFEYDFFIKEAVKGSDFINEQILYPSGCYALPRKAKTSLGITAPPLAGAEVKTIDWTNVTNASGIVIDRNINSNFYNSVIYKYDKDQVTDKYKKGKIIQSADSTNRIKVANKPLNIESDGIRSANFSEKVSILSRKLLTRYQFAAESLDVEVSFGFGFTIEIGDVVILQGSELKILDNTRGDRNFQPRLFEVQNKAVRLSGQPIRLKLVDTAFSTVGRYGVFSPSSKASTGSTTTVLNLKKSYGTNLGYKSEQSKYSQIIGAKLLIRSPDHTTYNYERYLLSLDPNNTDGIILSAALPTPPLEDYIIEVAPYSSSLLATDEALTKLLFCSFDAQIAVVSGASSTVFDIGGGDLSKVAVGTTIYLHDADYSNQSSEVKIIDITGTTITVDTALGFTPDNTYFVELNTFADNGNAYRWY